MCRSVGDWAGGREKEWGKPRPEVDQELLLAPEFMQLLHHQGIQGKYTRTARPLLAQA